MSLHLTGKGSILDAIGGALNTGANAVVAGAKDVGDLGSLGLANLTGNQVAAGNARSAISNNDRNLSGQSLPQNLGGLSQDIGLTGMARQAVAAPLVLGEDIGTGVGNMITGQHNSPSDPNLLPNLRGARSFATNHGKTNIDSPRALAGNIIGTGVNALTLGKGKAAEQTLEKGAESILGKGAIDKTLSRIFASGTTAGGYGAGQGTANAVATAQTPGQVASDILKPTIQNAIIGGAAGGVTRIPALSVAAKDEFMKAGEGGGLHSDPHAPSTPSWSDVPHGNEPTPSIDWTKVQGANKELSQTVQETAQGLRQQDLMMRPQPTDLYKQIQSAGGIGSSEYDNIPLHLKRKTGMSMDRVAQELGYPDHETLHEAILREGEIRSTPNAPLKTAAEYKTKAAKLIHDNPHQFDNVEARAKAENSLKDQAAADKASGYDKAKYQVPKGSPDKKFSQLLYDKTHSPEFQARGGRGVVGGTGAQLSSTRDTLEMTKANLKDAQKAFDHANKRGTPAAREVARQNLTRAKRDNVFTVGQEQIHSLAYKRSAEALDAAHPDVNLTAKSGVRLTRNQPYEVAHPVKVASSAPQAPTEAPAPPMESTITPGKSRIATKINALPAEGEVPKGPNLNEGAFGAEDQAKLEEIIKKEEAARDAPASTAGDEAILQGIKDQASDADIVKSYMEATGADEATAKKAYGIIEDNPHAETAGAAENNPLHEKVASPKIETPKARSGTVRLLSKSGSYVRNNLIKAAMSRATGGKAWLDYLEGRSKQEFDKLAPEDQALADNLRNHSIEEVAKGAKDPEAFTTFAKRAAYIQDYLSETKRLYNSGDPTLYRKNYGAKLYAAEPGAPEHAPATPKEFPTAPEDDSRHYHSYQDLEEATGQVRTTKNFMEDLSKDISKGRYDTTQRNLLHGLRQGFGEDKVSFGDTYNPQHVQLKDFPSVYADKEIAGKINSRSMHEYNKNVGGQLAKLYDEANNAQKTTKLSGSGFHHINIGLSATALDPRIAVQAARATVDPQFFLDSMDKWESNGTLEKYLNHGGTLGGGSEFDSGINKVPGIKQLHASLFQREIPYAKVANFEKFTKGMNPNTAEGAAKLGRVANATNEIFGGMNRVLSGLPPGVFKVVARGVLAVDYNEGQIRTLIAAVARGGPEGRMARQMIGGRAAILATPGSLQAIASGQIGNNPEDILKFVGKQLVDPSYQTGWKTAGGNPKEISGLATVTNKLYRAVAPALNPNNPDKTSGLKSEASGNLAALLAAGQEEINNRDFYGNPMHGHGLNAAEDVGQLLNTAAPIPNQPGARYLEGTRFGKNEATQIAAGGQSAISPGEAAIDISGVGRVKANPDAPAMQIMNNRALLREGLSTHDQSALDQIHPSWDPNSTKASQNAVYASPYYESQKWQTLAENPAVLATLAKQNAFAKAHGEPSNPLFDLSPQDQKTLITYERLKTGDPGSDANDSAAFIYANNKPMISKYQNDVAAYSTDMNALYKASGGLKGSTAPQATPGGIPFPQVSSDTQTSLNTYYSMLSDPNSTSKDRAVFLTNNPSVTQALNATFNYHNAQRASLDEPQLNPYPTAPAGLQSWIDSYINGSKAARAGLRNANMGNFNAMQDYMAKVDEYTLAQTAGQAKFQGSSLSQSNLKSIYNLGQYDIAPSIGADGTTSYSVDPAKAFAASKSGGGSSSSSSAVQRLLNDIERSHADAAVRHAGKKAYIRKAYKNKIYLRPAPHVKGVPNRKITIKSAPVS